MADEKKINISIGAGTNVSSEEHSTYIEIQKFHQSTLELPYEPKGVSLDKASLTKLIKLLEELMSRIELWGALDTSYQHYVMALFRA